MLDDDVTDDNGNKGKADMLATYDDLGRSGEMALGST